MAEIDVMPDMGACVKFVDQCDYAWGDWHCVLPSGHGEQHELRWASDEDDE